MFLFTISSIPSAAQKAAPAGWRVELEEGKTARSSLTINNRCSAPHLFRVRHKIKYLRFEQATDSILVGANSSTAIRALFDSTGLKSKQYRDKVIVECLDCKKEKTCHQDRDELAVELTVTKPGNRNVANSLQPDVAEKKLTSSQLRRVTNDEKFKAALAVVAEQNESVDLKSGRLMTSPTAPNSSEIAFRVTAKGTSTPGEYAKLVYMEQPGGPPLVFFDEKQTGGIAAAKIVQQGGKKNKGGFLGCLFVSWGPWTILNSSCRYNFWCFFKSQRAIYIDETRTRKCPNGVVQTQTRTVKLHCGC